MNKIFISYRREDTGDFVDQFVDALKMRLPDDEVFLDIGGIKVAEDWMVKLQDEIDASQMVLVLIGANWLRAESNRRRRIDDRKDILRREVEWAHNRKKTVIPVLVGSVAMPKESDLPADIRFLHRLQAQAIRDESFDKDVDDLAAGLRELFAKAARETEEADALLDELDDEIEWNTPGAVYIEEFAVVGDWTCEVRSPIANDPSFTAEGRATIQFRISAAGGAFEGIWKCGRKFRIEGNWMIGTGDRDDPKRVTGLRLRGVADRVDPFDWEFPIGERMGDGYRGVDAEGRHYVLHLVEPPKPVF